MLSSWPTFTKEESDAVRELLLSNKVNYWTGDECRKFEKEFAIWSESNYAVTFANGTLALDAAFKALNVGKDDEVIVTSRTFIASISSIVNTGAVPIFADVDLSSQNITSKTKWLILNSPANPSGSAYTLNEYKNLADVSID